MQEMLKKLTERIRTRDGMAVTATIWEQAHSFHLWQQQAHALFGHGPGIITGLKVNAERQAGNRRVWISAGMAIDPQGNAIILEEQDSHMISEGREGVLHIFMERIKETVFDASKGASKTGPLQVREGYVIESALKLPENAIELARIKLWGRDATIVDAKNPDLPITNEIDMRFRREVGAVPKKVARIGIVYVGQTQRNSLPNYGLNTAYLARALTHQTKCQVWADDEVIITPESLDVYSMVYLVEHPQSRLSSDEVDALRIYLRDGGILYVENYQRGTTSPSLEDLSKVASLQFQDLSPDHHFLVTPFPFAALPPGLNPQGLVRIGNNQMGSSVIFSTCEHGRLWQRQRDYGRLPSREEIRSSLEWLSNIVLYAVERERQYKRR